MDDIFRMSSNESSAQFGNNLVEEVTGEKSLDINLDKSSYIVMGNKSSRRKLKAALEKSPLKLCDENMKEERIIKLLGDQISYNLEDSVYQTVLKRAPIVKHAIFEIRTVIEDLRSDKLGAIKVALDLWELAIKPMLTFNCETWVCINKKTLKILDDLFFTFCRTIFRVSVSCPIGSFYIETGSLKFSNFILERQLNFLFHLAHLPEMSLGREVLEEQIAYSLPGLYQQNEQHIQNIGYINFREMTKNQWHRRVKEYVFKRNVEEVLESIKDSKKLNYEEVSAEKYERKAYLGELDLEHARMLFRFHSRLIPSIRKNFSSKYRRMGVPLTCPSCSRPSTSLSSESSMILTSSETIMNNSSSPPRHSQSHLLTSCVAVKDIRDECSPWEDDKSLAVFFKRVVARHLEMGLD